METVVYEERVTCLAAEADRDTLWLDLDDLERASGWALRPEGVCRDGVCVPLADGGRHDLLRAVDGRFDLAGFARLLGQPVVRDPQASAWGFGPVPTTAPRGGAPLVAPDFSLPDLHGRQHALSGYRGRKVLIVSWASW
jgi:hypothetical protein